MFNDRFKPIERRPVRYGRPRSSARALMPLGNDAAARDRLWRFLRAGGLDGIVFERSLAVGGLVPAFTSHARMVVVEIMESGWSEGALAGDTFWQRRRRIFREAGYKVIHVPADEPWEDTQRRLRRLFALANAEGSVVRLDEARGGDAEGE